MSHQSNHAPPSGSPASSIPANNSHNHNNGQFTQNTHGLHSYAYRNMSGIQTPLVPNHTHNSTTTRDTISRDTNSRATTNNNTEPNNTANTTQNPPLQREISTIDSHYSNMCGNPSRIHNPIHNSTTTNDIITRDINPRTTTNTNTEPNNTANTQISPSQRDISSKDSHHRYMSGNLTHNSKTTRHIITGDNNLRATTNNTTEPNTTANTTQTSPPQRDISTIDSHPTLC